MADNEQPLIPVTEWHQLTHLFGDGGVPMPFVKNIFLLDSNVAGTGFVPDIEQKTAALGPGSPLTLRREPENKHDARAIQILNAAGERIGYVPRADNQILSRLMDAGKLLFAKVREKHTSGDWISLAIAIYLRDL